MEKIIHKKYVNDIFLKITFLKYTNISRKMSSISAPFHEILECVFEDVFLVFPVYSLKNPVHIREPGIIKLYNLLV